MSSTFGNGSKVKIELEKKNYKPGKFKKMVDPTVVSAPFTLIVDEDKCMGCAVCMRNCPGNGIDMVPKSKYSDVQAPPTSSTVPPVLTSGNI
jgi:NAD-dependent dihydropyrimidine dehydrogenase PreA subunit